MSGNREGSERKNKSKFRDALLCLLGVRVSGLGNLNPSYFPVLSTELNSS